VLAQLEAVLRGRITTRRTLSGLPDVWRARLQGKDGCSPRGSERISAELLQACPQLKICANMAVGFNNFDVPAMTASGVQGTNAPDVLTETTADFGFALMMATARRMTESEHFLRRWLMDSAGATTCFAGSDSAMAPLWASSAWGASGRALRGAASMALA